MKKELAIAATTDNLQAVLDFVNKQLEINDCTMKAVMQVDVAVEEIFVNIAHYAYNSEVGEATVVCEVNREPLSVTITFIDTGIPYDPLSKVDPDVTLSADARNIGGLGIYMVKKTMDSVEYEYIEDKNVLKIRKIF